MTILRVVFLFAFVFLTSCQSQKAVDAPPSHIRTFAEPAEPGGGPRNQAFTYENGNCKVRWNLQAKRDQPNEKFLTIRDDCRLGDTYAIYAELLDAVVKFEAGSPITTATIIGWHDHSPSAEAMALECMEAPEWTDFLKKRQAKKAYAGNDAFVRIFNRADLGQDLKLVFAKYGYGLELKGVEKVFESPANQLPFAPKHPKLAPSTRRLPYGAGIYDFKVTKEHH